MHEFCTSSRKRDQNHPRNTEFQRTRRRVGSLRLGRRNHPSSVRKLEVRHRHPEGVSCGCGHGLSPFLIRIPAKPKKRTNQDLRLPKRVADRKRRISKYSSKRVWTTKRRSSSAGNKRREAAAETEDDSPENPELHEGIPTYKNNEHGLVRCKFTPDGVVNIQLTNFYARIKADVTRDDGVDQEHAFVIEASLPNFPPVTFTVPSKSFGQMNWPVEQMGSRAIVYAGASIKDHCRVAIQDISGSPEQRTVYTHLGWRKWMTNMSISMAMVRSTMRVRATTLT